MKRLKKLQKCTWFQAVKEFLGNMADLNLSSYSAAGSFYILLSLPSMAVLICSLVPYTPLTIEMLQNWMSQIMPDALSDIPERILRSIYRNNTAALSLSLLLSVYSGSKGISAVMQGLGQASGDPLGQKFLKRRALAVMWTLGFALILVCTAATLMVGEKWFPSYGDSLLVTLLRHRYQVAFPLFTVVILLLYKGFSSIRHPFRRLLPGALFTAAAWIVFSWWFTRYGSTSEEYFFYGSLESAVISLLWVYYCLYLLMVGQYINYYFINKNKKTS